MHINDLIDKIKNHFTSVYNKGLKESNTFIAFEPLGQKISADDFKTDDGLFSDAMATDVISLLADVIPSIDDDFTPGGVTTVSGLYETILDSLKLYENNITGDKGPVIELYSKLLLQARTQLDVSKQASLISKMSYTYPCYAFPSDWYDKDKKEIWATFQSGKLEKEPLQQPVKPAIKATTKPIKKFGFWQSVSDKKTPSGIFQRITKVVDHRKKVVMRAATVHVPTTPVIKEVKNVTDNNFSIEFDYCFVSLKRPWLSSSLFYQFNNWYALTKNAGAYSTGENTTENKGLLCSIPKAMLVIKDLKINASWTADDRDAANKSKGLGFFNITNNRFNKTNTNELVSEGIQVLGWVCEVLPKLPVYGDPNIL
jgi:hypothetical protein